MHPVVSTHWRVVAPKRIYGWMKMEGGDIPSGDSKPDEISSNTRRSEMASLRHSKVHLGALPFDVKRLTGATALYRAFHGLRPEHPDAGYSVCTGLQSWYRVAADLEIETPRRVLWFLRGPGYLDGPVELIVLSLLGRFWRPGNRDIRRDAMAFI